MKKIVFISVFLLLGWGLRAQVNPTRPRQNTLEIDNNQTNTQQDVQAGQRSTTPRKDSLGFEHRDDAKDSLVLSYRFLDSTRRSTLDSSVNDFDKYFSIPSSHQFLGNNGSAAFPLIYQPQFITGFDPGFHAFDLYRYTLAQTKYYRTNRPFSSLGYQLAAGKEQMLRAGHTQNPRQNLNIGFDYRLISAPGFFITQNNNHNAYRIFGNYQGKRKRYNAYGVLFGNTIRASQNGGIRNDSNLLDPNYKDRFAVKVYLGAANQFRQNPFVTSVTTGNTYKEVNFFLRQSYDIGKRDSVAVNDSTTEYLFYPKLRVQYSFTHSNSRYRYSDAVADSILYKEWFNVGLGDSIEAFSLQEKWRVMNHELSLIQFPDTKNPAQFFLAGAGYQRIIGQLKNDTVRLYNLKLHAEYRNRTRNKLWDVLLKGEFYVNGLNSGDYHAYASLERVLNRKLGFVRVFFANTNRTPSFVFDNRSSFKLENDTGFNKENHIYFGAEAVNPYFSLMVKNHLISNLSYFQSYSRAAQYSKLINLLQLGASKKIKLTRRLNLYSDAVLQLVDAATPIRVPLFFTRNRLAFEGKFFKNLNLSTGIEARYYSPYKANNYSPVTGQFTVQDTVTISNLPDIHAFVHFRIKGFTAYFRGENLNSVTTRGGFGFLNNNFAAPHYPTPGFLIRFGIQWWFVN